MYSVYFSPVQTFERKKGRLSLRWMGDVEIDLRNIGAKIWRIRGLDRSEWAYVSKETKAKLKVLKKEEKEDEEKEVCTDIYIQPIRVISGLGREMNEIFIALGRYAVVNRSFMPTF